MDLRERVVALVAQGCSTRATAKVFGVSVASVVKWSQRQRRTGSVAPGKMGGHRRPLLLAEREWLLARLADQPDLTLRALLAELSERGTKVSYGALWLFLQRQGLSFKKNRARQRAGSAGDCLAVGRSARIAEDAGKAGGHSGRSIRAGLKPAGSSSSTRPGRRPT
jgi:transposase